MISIPLVIVARVPSRRRRSPNHWRVPNARPRHLGQPLHQVLRQQVFPRHDAHNLRRVLHGTEADAHREVVGELYRRLVYACWRALIDWLIRFDWLFDFGWFYAVVFVFIDWLVLIDCLIHDLLILSDWFDHLHHVSTAGTGRSRHPFDMKCKYYGPP